MFKIYCLNHNKECVMADINKESTFRRRFGCSKCIEEAIKSKIDKFDQIKSLESFWAQWEAISKDNKSLIQETMKKIDEHTKGLSTFNSRILNNIVELTNFFLQKLQDQLKVFEVEPQYLSEEDFIQIAENLSNQEDYLGNFKSQQEDYYNSYLTEIQNILDLHEIKIIYKVRKHNLSIVHQQINIKVTTQKKSYYQKGIIPIFIGFCILMIIISNLPLDQINSILKNNQTSIKSEKEVNLYSYEDMESNIKEYKCQLFAFNSNNSKMIAGCEKNIIVFEFNDGKLSSKQTISYHNSNISALYFMKKSNQFISGDNKGSMLIWKLNEINKWIKISRYEELHKDRINQIIMNSKEDLIITCSNDMSIRFLKCEESCQLQKKSYQQNSQVSRLSFNEVEDQLISSDNKGSISVMNILNQDNWEVNQYNAAKPGFQLTFIDTNQFVYQSNNGDIQVFKLNDGEYSKTDGNKNICNLPQIIEKQKSILISINDKQIHIIKKNQNGDLYIYKSIEIQHNPVYGLSNDGKYLITLDEKNQLQLKQFVQQN